MDEQSPIAATLAQVGSRLKRIRTQRGVSLSALAESTGISKSTLSRLETGRRRPSLELLLPIAQTTNCRWTSWSARRRSATRGSGPGPGSATAAR